MVGQDRKSVLGNPNVQHNQFHPTPIHGVSSPTIAKRHIDILGVASGNIKCEELKDWLSSHIVELKKNRDKKGVFAFKVQATDEVKCQVVEP